MEKRSNRWKALETVDSSEIKVRGRKKTMETEIMVNSPQRQ